MNSDKILFKLHAEVCNSMGHPIRLETVFHLKEAELSFSEIVQPISEHGRSPEKGDGIIYVSNVEKAYRVKTGMENGEK